MGLQAVNINETVLYDALALQVIPGRVKVVFADKSYAIINIPDPVCPKNPESPGCLKKAVYSVL